MGRLHNATPESSSKNPSLAKSQSALDQYYAQLASSAALITQLQHTWNNLKTFNPYILQQNTPPSFKKAQENLDTKSEILSTPQIIPSDLTLKTNADHIRSTPHSSAFSISGTPSEKPSTAPPFLHFHPIADNSSGNSASSEKIIASDISSISSKSFTPWSTQPPFSLNWSPHNPLGASGHPLTRQSFLYPFPYLRSNLASAFKMWRLVYFIP